MRSFSGLYFFLRFVVLSASYLCHAILRTAPMAGITTIFFATTIITAIAMPYRKAYANYLDILLLSNLTVLCYTQPPAFSNKLLEKLLLAAPMAIMILTITLQKLSDITMLICKTCVCTYKLSPSRFINSFFRNGRTSFTTQASSLTSPQPLIHPTHTIISYGTIP